MLIVTNTDEDLEKFQEVFGFLAATMDVVVFTSGDTPRTDDEIAKLKDRPPHILIGTVEGMMDIIQRKALESTSMKIFVIDAGEFLCPVFPMELPEDITRNKHLRIIHSWMPTEYQGIFLMSHATSGTDDAIRRRMQHPINVVVHERQQDLTDGGNESSDHE